MKQCRLSVLIAYFMAGAPWSITAAESTVRLTRVPGHGVQPKAIVDHKGTLHLVYLAAAVAHPDGSFEILH